MNSETLRILKERVAEIHRGNTKKVVNLINRDFYLSNLDTIFDQQIAEIYRKVIPRHSELCELDQSRGLTDVERCELAVGYASMYPTFGHEGIIVVSATYLANRSNRQAKSS